MLSAPCPFRARTKERRLLFCLLPRVTHLYLLEHPVRDDHPARSTRPSTINLPARLGIQDFLVVRFYVRRVEDENVYRVGQPGEERRSQVRQDRVERDPIGEPGEGGAARCVRV